MKKIKKQQQQTAYSKLIVIHHWYVCLFVHFLKKEWDVNELYGLQFSCDAIIHF